MREILCYNNSTCSTVVVLTQMGLLKFSCVNKIDIVLRHDIVFGGLGRRAVTLSSFFKFLEYHLLLELCSPSLYRLLLFKGVARPDNPFLSGSHMLFLRVCRNGPVLGRNRTYIPGKS